MTKRLVLHIGRHKTGTKAIQDRCRELAPVLARDGILYPETGRRRLDGRWSSGQHDIALQCQAEQHDPQGFAALKSAFAREAEGYATIILSSEAFQNLDDLALLDRFFDGFADYEVTIVCYLREYLGYLVSSYRQMVQNRPRFMTFGDYCRRGWGIEDFLALWSRFDRLLLRPFDRGRLRNGNVVDDFFDLLGLDPGPGEESGLTNPSIGGNLLFFRLVENRLGLEPLASRMADELAAAHPPFRLPFRIDDEAAAAIRASNPYNRLVFDRVGEMALESFAGCPAVPVAETLEADLRRVYDGRRRDEMREAVEGLADHARGWLAF